MLLYDVPSDIFAEVILLTKSTHKTLLQEKDEASKKLCCCSLRIMRINRLFLGTFDISWKNYRSSSKSGLRGSEFYFRRKFTHITAHNCIAFKDPNLLASQQITQRDEQDDKKQSSPPEAFHDTAGAANPPNRSM